MSQFNLASRRNSCWSWVRLNLLGLDEKLPESMEVPVSHLPALSISPDDRVRYHMAEFTALKAEISELVEQTYAYVTYGFGITGAVYSWILAQAFQGVVLALLIWIPWITATLLSQLAVATRRRITLKGAYLRRLESVFRARDLGWERVLEQKGAAIGDVHMIAWLLLWWSTLLIAIGIDIKESIYPDRPSKPTAVEIKFMPS